MKFLLVFLGIFFLFKSAFCIKCYNNEICEVNDETCIEEVEDCPEFEYCFKDDVFGKDGVQYYVHRYCDYMWGPGCNLKEVTTPKVQDHFVYKRYCCNEDLCNGSGNLSKTNLLLFAVVFHAVSNFFF